MTDWTAADEECRLLRARLAEEEAAYETLLVECDGFQNKLAAALADLKVLAADRERAVVASQANLARAERAETSLDDISALAPSSVPPYAAQLISLERQLDAALADNELLGDERDRAARAAQTAIEQRDEALAQQAFLKGCWKGCLDNTIAQTARAEKAEAQLMMSPFPTEFPGSTRRVLDLEAQLASATEELNAYRTGTIGSGEREDAIRHDAQYSLRKQLAAALEAEGLRAAECHEALAERDEALQEMDKWRMEAQGDQSEFAAALARAEKAENERDTWQLRAEGFERWKKNYPLLMNDLVHTRAQLAEAEEALSAGFSYLSGAGLAAHRGYRIKYPEEEK